MREPESCCGRRLRFHADFDWGGIRIGNVLVAALGAEAWRFSAADYLTIVKLGTSTNLEGGVVRASWDPRLAEAMQAQGRALVEEQVVDVLLGDLQRGERPGSAAS